MIRTAPPSSGARKLREAVAASRPSQELEPMIRDLSRQAEILFRATRRVELQSGSAQYAGMQESGEFVLDVLAGMADSIRRSSTTHVLSTLTFVERALRMHELMLPQGIETGSDTMSGGDARASHPCRGRALVVDDEQAFSHVVCAWLQDAGFEVTEVARADEARRLLSHSQWDLLFADVVLPGGGDGFDVADAALRANIGIGVIFATGFTPRPRPMQLRSWPLLQKPFGRGALEEALTEVATLTSHGRNAS